MKLVDYGKIRILGFRKQSSVAKKDKGKPDRGTERPDRSGDNPRPDTNRPPRPDRAFEDDLPGEVIVPDRDYAGEKG